MELSAFILPLLCVISPFVLGWVVLSIIVGVRGGWEAGIRLFLLGLGFLGGVLVISGTMLFLPDWLAATMMILLALLPWLSLMVYFLRQNFSGRALLTLSLNEKWSTAVMSGTIPIIFGLTQFISHPNYMSIVKSYALGVCLISFGLIRVLKKVHCTQIREKGILYENGGFYEWDNIEVYVWKFAQDKLALKLRKSFLKRNVNLKIRSQFRQEVVAYLAQNVNNKVERASSTPFQTKNAG